MNYDYIKKVLDENFKAYEVFDKTYYLNNGEVVATLENNTINLYVEILNEKISSDSKFAVVSVIKDFVMKKDNEAFIADAIRIDGLFNSVNSIRRVNHAIITEDADDLLTFEDKIFPVGDLIPNYLKNMSLLDSLGVKHDIAKKVERLRMLSSNDLIYLSMRVGFFGRLGAYLKSVDFYSRYFSFEVTLNKTADRYRNSVENLNYGLISNVVPWDLDLNEVYQYYTNKYEWNYTGGKDSEDSPEIIDFVEQRRFSNYNNLYPVKVKDMN